MGKFLFEARHSTSFIFVVMIVTALVEVGSLWTAFAVGLVGSLICGVFEAGYKALLEERDK